MLTIKAEIRPSSKPELGMGLFTLQDINKGDIIWQYKQDLDVCVDVNHLNTLTYVQQDFLNKYGWREDDRFYLSCDNSKYINHSASDANLVCGEADITYASRDIKAGEELFIDYGSFDDDYDNYSSTLI